MSDSEDTLLNDESSWRKEARAVIDDVKGYVTTIAVADKLPSKNSRIYLNATTLEGQKLCVELTPRGFCIVGEDHDVVDRFDGMFYETPYALLGSCSKMFREAFDRDLARKLEGLQNVSQNRETDKTDA